MSDKQKIDLLYLLQDLPVGEFHHGDCIGADFEAAHIARKLGYTIVCHPPTIDAKREFFPSDVTFPALPYLARNKAIVNATEVLFAAPKETEEVIRSGTWATVRYARKVGKPVYILERI